MPAFDSQNPKKNPKLAFRKKTGYTYYTELVISWRIGAGSTIFYYFKQTKLLARPDRDVPYKIFIR